MPSFRMFPRPATLDEVIEVLHKVQEHLVRGEARGGAGGEDKVGYTAAADSQAPVGKTTMVGPPPSQRGFLRVPPAHSLMVVKGSDLTPTDRLVLKTPHTGTISTDTILLASDGRRLLEVAKTHKHLETIFTSTASVTIGFGDVGPKSLIGSGVGDRTLTPNLLVPGRTIRISVRGVILDVNGNLRFKTLLGSTVIADTGFQSIGLGVGAAAWELNSVITCRTNGAAGTVIEVGWVGVYALNLFSCWPLETAAATMAVDTTASQLVEVTGEFSAPGVGDFLTATVATVEVLN